MSAENWLQRSSGLVVPALGFANNLAGQMQPCPDGDCCEGIPGPGCRDCLAPPPIGTDPALGDIWFDVPAMSDADCTGCASTAQTYHGGVLNSNCRTFAQPEPGGVCANLTPSPWTNPGTGSMAFNFGITNSETFCLYTVRGYVSLFHCESAYPGFPQFVFSRIFWQLTLPSPSPWPLDITLPFSYQDNGFSWGLSPEICGEDPPDGSTTACNGAGTEIRVYMTPTVKLVSGSPPLFEHSPILTLTPPSAATIVRTVP